MTLQNKITQIILDGAPVDMTIAQIKLMAAKLVALVDNPEITTPSYDIKSINGVDIDASENCIRVVAMAELGIDIDAILPETRTLQSSDGEKFTITEYGKGTALIEFDTSDNMWVLYGYDKLSEEYIDKLIADFTKQTGATTVYSKDWVYVWRNGKREKIAYNYNGEKITLSESVHADAIWKSTLKPSEPKPMTICYGNSMDDMFIRYRDERNHWALYNWRMVDVDERDKWLEEARIKLFINVVVSDDLQWIWRNGEWAKAEKWEVS